LSLQALIKTQIYSFLPDNILYILSLKLLKYISGSNQNEFFLLSQLDCCNIWNPNNQILMQFLKNIIKLLKLNIFWRLSQRCISKQSRLRKVHGRNIMSQSLSKEFLILFSFRLLFLKSHIRTYSFFFNLISRNCMFCIETIKSRPVITWHNSSARPYVST
jgi:hypothetical protein